jgi:RNA-directed DNA polymerase
MDQGVFQPTQRGTPQGGVLSPLLANIALHGLETDTKEALGPRLVKALTTRQPCLRDARKTLQVIRYADDFVVIHKDESIVKEAEKYIASWVGKMGLQLKAEKTRIVHSLQSYEGNEPGFNFLGFNCRQYRKARGKMVTLIKPEKNKLHLHLREIGGTLRDMGNASQEAVIDKLNPKITGWSNYYRTCVASKTFCKADYEVFRQLSNWIKRKKDRTWKALRKYFREVRGRKWAFATKEGQRLTQHSATKIVRYVKVQGSRSPFDGDWAYWATRLGYSPLLPQRQASLLKEQKGLCGYCKLHFRHEDILEVHHVDGNHKNEKKGNLLLIHGHCHDQVTAQMRRAHDKGSVAEEPCAVKVASTVL